MKDLLTTEIIVKENKIGIMRVGDVNYISLTDLAKYQNSSDPSFTVKNWLRRINTIDYVGLWEQLHNQDFNLVEFDQIKTEYGKNSFAMSPTQWIKRTNAIGIVSKGGRYSVGTFAHPDIAFEFASWLSPEFKLYLIMEFERLKKNEDYQYKIEWSATRLLSKANYIIHTDAIKNCIVPTLTEEQKQYVYAEEGNIRDYTDLLHLVILNNLQNTNALLIEENIPQGERLIKLNNSARYQIKVLANNRSLKDLELLQNQINENKLLEN